MVHETVDSILVKDSRVKITWCNRLSGCIKSLLGSSMEFPSIVGAHALNILEFYKQSGV